MTDNERTTEEQASNDEHNARILDLAHEQWQEDGKVEIDDQGPHPVEDVISEGNDNGAYVRAWVWVDFAGTDLDQGDEDEEDLDPLYDALEDAGVIGPKKDE